jgi:ABC-type multidrug transport system fused ATPase/permease subunit
VPLLSAIAGATVYAVMSIAGAMVLGLITDDVITPAFADGVSDADLWSAVALVLVIAAIRSIGVSSRRYFAGMTTRRMQATWRRRLAATYLGLPLARTRQLPTGELLAHVDNDVIVGTEALGPLPFAIGVVVLVFFSTISLAVIDVWLLVVGLALFPSITWLSHAYSQRVVGPATEVQERVADVSAIVHESVDGALVVKTLGRESEESRRLDEAAEALRVARVRFGRMRAVFEPILDALPSLGSVILLGVGAWRVSTGSISTGDVIQALALFQVLAFPMRVLGYFLEELPLSVVASERLDRITSEPTFEPPEQPRRLPEGALSLSVDHLSVTLDGHDVLRDVSFTIEPGEVVALVGATGSGKSTLVAAIAGLLPRHGGSVILGGEPLDEVDPESLHQALGLVFQEAFLFADTVGSNIDVSSQVSPEEIIEAAEAAQAHQFISVMPSGYQTLLGERGVSLSGGQRQRTALARALARRPQFLVLDDATSAVDPLVEEAILAGLRNQLDTTALIVANRVSTIALADRVLFLDDGHIAAVGPHDELLSTTPAYARLVRAYEDSGVQL